MESSSARFAESIVGTHRAVSRVQLLLPNVGGGVPQFGSAPTGGLELPLLDGDITMNSTADIKATLSVTIPGDYWDEVAPFGAELFCERGVDFGDGTRELIPLGYYRIEGASQDRSPYGPIRVDADDRSSAFAQIRIIYPYQVPAGTTHRQLFNTLVNGSTDLTAATIATYGMYPGKAMTILWDRAGYDPDAATITSGPVVDDSVSDFLSKLVAGKGAVIRFRTTGEMSIERRDPDLTAPADFVLREGATGTLVQASRSINRTGVINMVRATGSDPAHQTGYRLSYITDPNSPLRWNGPFGPSVRYYASPVLTTSDEADAAAETILGHSTGLPTEQSLWAIPDPRVRPLDVAGAIVGNLAPVNQVVDEITIPLVGDSPLLVKTRTLNTVPVNPTDPEPPVVPIPDDPDPADPGGGDPGGGGSPTPGGGDPTDGVQAALMLGWGSIIDGDECTGTGRPTGGKWGLYDGAGHDGNGRRVASAWNYHDGILTCHGDGNGNTGGAAFQRGSYGYRLECRVRVYSTANDGGDHYHPVLILWPDSDNWPAGAEYDYFECDEGDTSPVGGFMHLPNHTPYRQDQFSIPADITQWNNYACEWNPVAQTLKQWTNGVLCYNGSGRVAQAPGPMHPTMQLDHFGGDPRSANFDLAWMRIYNKPNA